MQIHLDVEDGREAGRRFAHVSELGRLVDGERVGASKLGEEQVVLNEVVTKRRSPAPGFGEKYWSLSGFPSHSLESGGGAFLTIIFGQIFAYSAFSDSHFSSPGSVSGLIASTGHSGTQTPQSMHSSGWMTSMFSPS